MNNDEQKPKPFFGFVTTNGEASPSTEGKAEPYRRKGRSVPLTSEETVAQINLKQMWNTTASGLGLTQASMARKYGVNPSHLSQIKNGFLPLNLTWLMRFSKELRLAPEEIFPNYREYFKLGRTGRGGEVPSVRLAARVRQGNVMPTTTRETIEYPNFSADSATEAVEVLSEGADHAFVPFGSHVLFTREVGASPADHLGVAIFEEDSSMMRIVKRHESKWVDVFDGMPLGQAWRVFKVQGILYNG